MKHIVWSIVLIGLCYSTESQALRITTNNFSNHFDANGYYKSTSPHNQSLFIGPGVVAKFKGDVFQLSGKVISVERGATDSDNGAEVHFEGVTITALDAIEVQGYADKSQLNSTQDGFNPSFGKLFMRGYYDATTQTYKRCKIINGTYGVISGLYQDLGLNHENLRGGIIRCAETDFIDQKNHSVWIRPYADPVSKGRNLCFFRDCTFKWTRIQGFNNTEKLQWLQQPLKSIIFLENVHGVTFMGKNIVQNDVLHTDWDKTYIQLNGNNNMVSKFFCDKYRGVGIRALNASLVMLPGPACYAPNDPNLIPYNPSHGCLQCTGDYNQINQFTHGVHYEITADYGDDQGDGTTTVYNSKHYLALTGTRFINNLHGAYIVGGKSIFINRDSFELNDTAGSYRIEPYAAGVWLDSCKSVDVSDNIFDYEITSVYAQGTDDDPGFVCAQGYSVGARYSNTAGNYNRSYHNQFKNALRNQSCVRTLAAEIFNQNN